MGASTADEKLTEASAVEDQHIAVTPTLATEIIDSRDVDKPYIYLARQNQSHVGDSVDLKALRRRIDWRIVPIIATCYGLQFLDKIIINVSQAL
jgi:hypothetical protein